MGPRRRGDGLYVERVVLLLAALFAGGCGSRLLPRHFVLSDALGACRQSCPPRRPLHDGHPNLHRPCRTSVERNTATGRRVRLVRMAMVVSHRNDSVLAVGFYHPVLSAGHSGRRQMAGEGRAAMAGKYFTTGKAEQRWRTQTGRVEGSARSASADTELVLLRSRTGFVRRDFVDTADLCEHGPASGVDRICHRDTLYGGSGRHDVVVESLRSEP